MAKAIKKDVLYSEIYSKSEIKNTVTITSINDCIKDIFDKVDAIIFIGAMGICIRSIAPYIKDKHTDPAIVNIDSTGRYVVSVLSGHVGGANDLTKRLALITGGEAVITTQSDNTNLWALDTIGSKFDWKTGSNADNFNHPLTAFVNKKATALLLDVADEGTQYLERTKPDHVKVFYKYDDINQSEFELLIAVTPFYILTLVCRLSIIILRYCI